MHSQSPLRSLIFEITYSLYIRILWTCTRPVRHVGQLGDGGDQRGGVPREGLQLRSHTRSGLEPCPKGPKYFYVWNLKSHFGNVLCIWVLGPLGVVSIPLKELVRERHIHLHQGWVCGASSGLPRDLQFKHLSYPEPGEDPNNRTLNSGL